MEHQDTEYGEMYFSPDHLSEFISSPLDFGFGPVDSLGIPPPQSLVAAELEPHSGFDLVSTPRDGGLPIEPLPPPPPLPIDHMSIDVPRSSVVEELQARPGGDFVSAPLCLVPPPLPAQTDLPALTVEEELQAWRLPNNLSSAPTDVELLENYLRPASRRLRAKSIHQRMEDLDCVNADLTVMKPWEILGVGVEREARRKGVHYLTDSLAHCFGITSSLITPDGKWKELRDLGTAVKAAVGNQGVVLMGVKKTFEFCTKGGAKTKWLMNVYSLLSSAVIEDRLALCHIFEQDSTGAKCLTFHQTQCNGSSATHHVPDRNSNPRLNSYISNLGSLDDHVPDTYTDTTKHCSARGVPPTTDHGKSKKRKKVLESDVWSYFTKIFARDLEGKKLTFAVCNHCSKVLTGGSNGGTSHLASHSCSCKLKPVEAGRKYNAGIGVSSS